ncbi:MAG: hypothetical protein Q8Q03_02345 [bacterium]|nr:hypothetical protein [bacterium]
MENFSINRNFLKWSSIFTIFLLFAFSLAVKINLPTADLGRHIKNGEIILNGTSEQRSSILHTNFYSYTETDFPFINHHWLSGVVFYITEKAAGFKGLSILYILLSLATLWLFFRIAWDKAGLLPSLTLALLAIPVIASRAEVRPEVFTYFFCGLFFYICERVSSRQISAKWLYALPLLEIVWVNLHSGFIFGIFIAGIYFFNSLICKKDLIKYFLISLILISAATVINPSGIQGSLVPFTIFNNYGYKIVENQSIPFLENLGVGNKVAFAGFKVLLAVAILSLILSFRKKVNFPQTVFATTFAVMSYLAIRNFPLFGYFAVPAAAIYFSKTIWVRSALAAMVITGLFLTLSTIDNYSGAFGIGLRSGVNNAAEFFKTQSLKGPIFNNYDIGGYLIYHLYPQEKVFYDNRPEAYSADFSQEVYVASLERPELFKKLDEKYNFNAIFFYHRDHTPWAQEFLIRIVKDPEWVTVFADDDNIILVRKSKLNP